MNARTMWKPGLLLPVIVALLTAAQEPSNRFYEAIRANDIAGLRAGLKVSDVNFRDQHGTTPLMYAAALGSLQAMKVLLQAGADLNAKNAFGATALMWCINQPDMVRLLVAKGVDVNARSKMGRTPLLLAASYGGNSEVVRLLLAKGAKVITRDNFEITPLIAATQANDLATVKLLLEQGADIKGVDIHSKEMAERVLTGPASAGFTPLMFAAAEGNVEVVRLLLARGADVNAVCSAKTPAVKNGPVALASLTALTLAAAYGGPDTIKVLLDHGAKVDAQDLRGMTPLMLAISTDRADARVVRLLLEKGADPSIKSASNETAIDWAKKYRNTSVGQALGLTFDDSGAAPVKPIGNHQAPELKEALAKSIGLLQSVSANFMKTGGCVSCHAQNLTGMAVQAARLNRVKVDETVSVGQAKSVGLSWSGFEQPFLQRMDSPGGTDDMEYSLVQMAADGVVAGRTIDAMIHNLAARQRGEGNWHNAPIGNRAPMEDTDFARTAMAVRSLRIYGPPSRKAEFDRRIGRASAWLQSANPLSTEDHNMQLLGLLWAGKQASQLQNQLGGLTALERADGGWSQTSSLASDAYATGQVLFTLHELGVPASDTAYRRGVEYLLRTQFHDGSWHVISRAVKFQPYFQSGFPHGQDQWISAAGTAWAAMGLAYAVGGSGQPVTLAAK
jgi:ankyrin repeat protein